MPGWKSQTGRLGNRAEKGRAEIPACWPEVLRMSYEEEKQDRKIEQLEAEIERLRAASIEYQNALDDVKNLEEQIETFHLRRGNELRQMNEISLRNKEQAARIKDLEHQLDTRSQEITGRIQECHACQAEGKIGSGDHIGEPNKLIGPDADARPHCWQITDERRKAIALLIVASNPEKIGNFDFEEEEAARAVLRVMLEEAGQ